MGKSIMATAVCKAIKKKYKRDNLIVVTAFPDVFLCNPYVDKCFGFNQLSYFYEQYIENKQFKIFAQNPYNDTSFIKGEKHLIETWCEMIGVDYDGEEPQIFLTDREVQYYAKQYVTPIKPILLLQTNGGANEQELKYSWARDIPIVTAMKIIKHFKEDYNILHIRRDDQWTFPDTTSVTASSVRELFCLVKLSDKRLFMDSFAQHTAKALGLNSVVCWIANTPIQFGYENNTNIIANKETKKPELKNSFLQKYNIMGSLIEFPYNSEEEIFNVEEIIEALTDTDGK
jgi:hypothetical protein